MSKLLGIDFGEKRIGLAISDGLKMIAFPLGKIDNHKNKEITIKNLLSSINNQPIDHIVIGLPLLMNGKDSPITTTVRDFAKYLEEQTQFKVTLWDERLSSKQVEKLMISGDVKRKQRSKNVDTLAATVILQSFLDANSFKSQL